MTEPSGYVLKPLREGADFTLYHGRQHGNPPPVLAGSERRRRLEADFFNLFNMAHFSNPHTTLGNAGFGTISGDRLPPRLIQLGAKFTF
jgi:hypothetical protein